MANSIINTENAITMDIGHIDGKIESRIHGNRESFRSIYLWNTRSYVKIWLLIILGVMLCFLFLPWTQNIRSNGYVTTLYQQHRPQQVNSQIPGKILKWYVKEGDMVQSGDTLLLLGEVKDEYLDPRIIDRTQTQIAENLNKVGFYEGKISTASQQIDNLQQQRDLKLSSLDNKREQIERKIAAAEAELAAANIDMQQGADQLERAKKMLEQEAISKFDFERRNATYQKAVAAFTDKNNSFANLKQDLIINRIDINNAVQEYAEKIAKAQGDQFSSSGEIATAREKVADLSIKKENLTSRAGYYFVLAPQAGQIVQAQNAGVMEIIKEGEMIVEIVPQDVQFAVEMFIQPVDLPLVQPGQSVRFMFDGFPAIVFSGWPQTSYGTFGGKVVAVESNRNINGTFRVLITEDPNDRKWPPTLRMGAGAMGFALLKDVPVWYELWRNINGFPPEFYTPGNGKTDPGKSKF